MIRARFRLQNVKFLTRFARHSISPVTKAKIFDRLLTAAAPMTIFELIQQINPENPADVLSAVFNMAFHHDLTLTLNDAPLSSTSMVTFDNLSGEFL